MGEQDQNNSDFQNFLPSIIAYAEGRMYRDLDMLATRFFDATPVLTAGSRMLALPANTLVVEDVDVIDSMGNRVRLVPVSREFLQFAYPNNLNPTVPQYFTMVGQLSAMVGPWPDQNYSCEVYGVGTQTPLSSGYSTTPLTQYVPEAFLACSMIEASAYQKNFGSQSDDPQQALSYEMQYKALMQSAAVYELRKRFKSEGWASQSPNPIAGAPTA
jgi:hypothetical protein